MALAIFDLDNTLIAGDSDHAWGEFLVKQGAVDADTFKRKNDEFYADYEAGELDIFEYIAFSLSPLTMHSKSKILALREQFMAECIEPMILPKAEALLAEHKAQGDTIVIITATNRFVTAPIAERLAVEHLIAIEVEEVDGEYTGNTFGTPSYREGKITRLEEWLQTHPQDLAGAHFYSDSHNDLPLLMRVEYPVAVDPDDTLRAYSQEHGWQILSLRD